MLLRWPFNLSFEKFGFEGNSHCSTWQFQFRIRKRDPPPGGKCPLCSWGEEKLVVDPAMLLDHIAEHIHSFSLYSLPWAETTADEEKARASGFENSVQKTNDWLFGFEHSVEGAKSWLSTEFHPQFRVKEDTRDSRDSQYYFEKDEYFAEDFQQTHDAGLEENFGISQDGSEEDFATEDTESSLEDRLRRSGQKG